MRYVYVKDKQGRYGICSTLKSSQEAWAFMRHSWPAVLPVLVKRRIKVPCPS